MSRYEDEIDVYQRYIYLFKPVADLVQNFEINIAEVLSECDDNPSFVTAATIIQGTSTVYARKVDLLHKMSLDFCHTFNNAPQKKRKEKGANHEKDDGNDNIREHHDRIIIHTDELDATTSNERTTQDPDGEYTANLSSSRVRVATQKEGRGKITCYTNQIELGPCKILENGIISRDIEDGLCIFETFYIHDDAYIPCYLTKSREFSLLFHMPGNMMPLMDFEKRRLSLYGIYGKYAEIDDYKLIRDTVSFDNALTFEGCHLIVNDNANNDRRRSSVYVVEMCRRFSEGLGIDMPHEIMSSINTLHENSFRLTEVPETQPADISMAASFNASFGSVNNNLVNNEFEARRSDRLASRSNSAAVEVENQPRDMFECMDIYDEVLYKCKAYKVAKNIDIRSLDLQKKRDNFIKRKATTANINIDALTTFMQTNFWRKVGKSRGDPVVYTVSQQFLPGLLICKKREKLRRNEIKIEMKKRQIQTRRPRNRQSNAVDVARNTTVERLTQHVANISIEPIGDDEWDGDIDIPPSTSERETPAPLGDFMPDHINDFEQYSGLNRTRKRNTVSTNQTVATQGMDLEHNLPQLGISMSEMNNFRDALRDMQGVETATPESIAAMVQVALAAQWHAVLQFQPVRHANYAVWEKKMMPILNDMKDDFMADDYGKRILQKFNGEVGKVISFTELAQNNPVERARFLLTILMFVNHGTLKIHSPKNNDESMVDENNEFNLLDGKAPEDFEIELLEDTEWHGDALNQSGLF